MMCVSVPFSSYMSMLVSIVLVVGTKDCLQTKYCIAGNIGGNYIWRIGGFLVAPPILNPPILRQPRRCSNKAW